jgi:hypothetical protein
MTTSLPGTSAHALKDVASVRGGYVGSSAITIGPGPGGIRALLARDVGAGSSVDWASLGYADPPGGGEQFRIRNGDVLYPLRSARPRAFVARNAPPDVIAAGQWALITPQLDQLRADYLAWFLNHPASAAALERLMQRGTLPFISLVSLRDLEIEVPPLAVQDRIIRVNELHQCVATLENGLAGLRATLIDAATLSALRSATHSKRPSSHS